MKRSLYFIVLAAFAALMTSGFQCASTGITSAKRAISNKDYVAAKKHLDEALAANPNDCEAQILLGEVAQLQGDEEAMIKAFEKAKDCPGLTDSQRSNMSLKMFNAWVVQYNAGITAYNTYIQKRDQAQLDKAIVNLTNAVRIKPTFTEPLSLLGGIYESKGDTANAYASYSKWWMVEKPGFDIMIDKDIAIGVSRDAALTILGKPAETRTDSLEGGGTVYKDKIDIGGRTMYVFSSDEKGGSPVLEGWTYNPPASISTDESWRSRMTSVGPLKAMAFIDYHTGKKEHALEMANVVGRIAPTDHELVPLRSQVLQDLGKTDDALREIERQVEKNPKQVNFRLQYATLLASAGKNKESIEQYDIVLKTEPANETALYNLAAAYKNLAGTKQRDELEKMDADKKYQPNLSYLEDLKTSASYFEKLRQASGKYQTDIIVLEQLANVYEVTKNKAKVKALIMELEGLEQMNLKNKTYYEIMEGLYSRNNMIDKMKEAAAKAAKL